MPPRDCITELAPPGLRLSAVAGVPAAEPGVAAAPDVAAGDAPTVLFLLLPGLGPEPTT